MLKRFVHRLRAASRRTAGLMLLVSTMLGGCAERVSEVPSPERPEDVPALDHVGLNSTDPERAIEWYLSLWPTAKRTEIAGRPAVAAEMYLVFDEVEVTPAGQFDPSIGRSEAQSAFWHIGAFTNTTDSDRTLEAMGTRHLPLFVGPSGTDPVWRSGQTPYTGIVTAGEIYTAEPAEARPGGFSYVLAPDGVLFELTGGPNTTESLSHVHFFHEQPRCAANWYVQTLGMALPAIRNEDGSTTVRPPYSPCEEEFGEAGWPSLERVGTLRQPRGTVAHGNGSMSWYPRQCVRGRCGDDEPLVPSRGQAIDHVAFRVDDVEAWYRWLESREVTVIEPLHDFDEGRAFMFEGPDRLAIELVESGAG